MQELVDPAAAILGPQSSSLVSELPSLLGSVKLELEYLIAARVQKDR